MSLFDQEVQDDNQEIETNCTPDIVCPSCGYQERNSGEHEANRGEVECSNCGETISYQREIEVTYSSWVKRTTIPNDLLRRINDVGIKVRSMAGQTPTIQKQDSGDVMTINHKHKNGELMITFHANKTGANWISAHNGVDRWFKCAIIEGNTIKPTKPKINRWTDLDYLEYCVGVIESSL